ncbi:hypothetical protein DPEC_G00069260 [Dallia pectoralis]|uniref:Uncharacterized protein n=1 Tax=Dallia pectoralis TaxID=75939 RepID=A0ACC2H1P2_DALPE|nr:hypothetical protein DPEC_G00069260 [Dallia pectoralis]
MVQAALGRNNLVQAMVRLAAKRQVRKVVNAEPDEDWVQGDRDSVSVCEALNTRYSDSEALRMILERYTNLYVQYIEVWRELCSKVSRDITVMEFVNLTKDRPGNIDFWLSSAPTDFAKRKGVLDAAIEDIRSRLDSCLQNWSRDACLNDLHFAVRTDLTVLVALVGVGEISVKTLLYERSMLISQVRNMTRTEGSLELQVAQTRAKLRESVARSRYAEMNALQ